MKSLARLVLSIAAIAFALTGCTTTYTEADLAENGLREDAATNAEMVEDTEIIEEGGVNNEAIDEEAESVERERDL